MIKTVVVLDMALCGTSMLAGVIHRLGIPMMGDNRRADRVEDLDVRDALQSEGAFAQLVKERSGRPWGFKWSELWRFEWMPQYLTDPVYFAIYKCPVSVCWRRHAQINGTAMLDIIQRMQASVCGIEAAGLPCHYVSYAGAMRAPLVFTRRIAHALRVRADDAQIAHAAQWIQPGGYNASDL